MSPEVLSAGFLLLLVLDPFGNMPIVLSALANVPRERHRRIIVRECAFAFVILLAFMLGGKAFLDFLQLSETSLAIAGGIVLFLIGLRMIFPPPEGIMGEIPDGEPFIVPIAIPMIAGPSGMAAVMLLGSQEPGRMGDWMLALTLAWGSTAIILFSATYLQKWLGTRVLTAIERLMGMVIVAISVQMLLDGITSYLRAGS